MSADLIRSAMLATAAFLELEGCIKQAEAAALRGDIAAMERARQRAHEHLDVHLDMKASAFAKFERTKP